MDGLTNMFNAGTQNHALLERLSCGPILNHQIVRELGILKYTGRISDVRHSVRGQGFDVVEERVGKSVHEYRIIRRQ